MLVTTDDLEKELHASNLVLIDTRSYKEYSQGHIPGAVNLDLFAFHWVDTSKEGLQSFEQQSKKILSFVGITESTKAVFYDDVSGMLAGYEHIQENLDKLVIIDARSKEEYDGTVIRAARSGHIPNAINIDWNLNLSGDGTMKDEPLLSKLYDFPKDAEVVTYCQGAYRAANSFVALKKLGFKNVKVYLGSWGEWGNKPELPAV